MVGIDDMAFYVPDFFLDMQSLAEARGLELDKLRYGLGLEKMAVPHPREDAATMAAEAVWQLITQNDLHPQQIGRIYLGTESAWDGAKPMASYTLEMLEARLEKKYGTHALENCDVVDLTFACIGAVDALQNTLDWAAASPQRIGIVVASDHAKYELGSGGEYTQGAGAVALLVKQQPRLLHIDTNWGVSARSVHDFHKPKRETTKEQLIEEVLRVGQISDISPAELRQKLVGLNGQIAPILGGEAEIIQIFKETPVFDGQFSNQCYQDRIFGAFQHFKKQNPDFSLSEWARLVFHLPYAKHGQRIFSQLFAHEHAQSPIGEALTQELGEPFSASPEFYKKTAKSQVYKEFAKEKIVPCQQASAEIGNMYTASVFMALMSTLENLLASKEDAAHEKIGFLAYGSGSKAKVFEGKLQPKWKVVVERFRVFERLGERHEIDYQTYHDFYYGKAGQQKGIKQKFHLQKIDEGKRTYAV